MSDTVANRVSGGAKIYIAVETTSLPALTGSTITLTNNDVQTITKTGTVSGGTATIEVIYADASSETTAAIAFDADAAAIKAALAALDNLDAADLTVTGGPFSTNPVIITFGGTYANTPMTLIEIDDALITGGGTLAPSHTTTGRTWTELPDIVGDYKVKRIHTTKPHEDAFAPHPTGSTTLKVGIDQMTYTIEESDLDAHNIGITAARELLDVIPAGAGQSGQESLLQPLPADIDASIYTILAVTQNNAGGWKKLEHFFKCKRKHDYEQSYKSGEPNTIDITWEVFADSTNDYRCSKKYEYKTAATS